MSADLLREAADRLDELAGAATPGPWEPTEEHGRDYTDEGWSHIAVESPDGTEVCVTAYQGTDGHDSAEEDAAYIAAMHPGVGKTLAAWLRQAWIDLQMLGELCEGDDCPDLMCPSLRHALAVARAVLGREQ